MSNKQTTAMQELIEMAKTAKEHSKDGYVTYDEVIEAATELLTKEREQINDAVSNALKLMCPTKDNLPNI